MPRQTSEEQRPEPRTAAGGVGEEPSAQRPSVAGPQLAQHGAAVTARRADRDAEPCGHGGGREPAEQQYEHVGLAGRQTGGGDGVGRRQVDEARPAGDGPELENEVGAAVRPVGGEQRRRAGAVAHDERRAAVERRAAARSGAGAAAVAVLSSATNTAAGRSPGHVAAASAATAKPIAATAGSASSRTSGSRLEQHGRGSRHGGAGRRRRDAVLLRDDVRGVPAGGPPKGGPPAPLGRSGVGASGRA